MSTLKLLANPDQTAVVISRRPKEGLEEAFATWAEGIYQTMSEQPGFRSYQAIPPVEGEGREWFFVFTFDGAASLQTWLHSETRARWQALGAHLTEGPGQTRVVSGLEHLFGLPADAEPPAVWKLAAATELGLAPTVFLVGLGLMQFSFYARWGQAGLWGGWWQVLLSTAICVSLMTWVVMPLLTRLLRRWLYPRAGRS